MRNEKPDALTGHPREGEAFPRPAQVKAQHRAKLAIVYVRTACITAAEDQLATQRALVTLPRLLGWPASRIRIIDRDCGRSAASVVNRPGFQHLRALIRRGQVGLVLVKDVSRLSRNPVELVTFLGEAAQASVVVLATEPVFYDLTACQRSAINGEQLRLE